MIFKKWNSAGSSIVISFFEFWLGLWQYASFPVSIAQCKLLLIIIGVQIAFVPWSPKRSATMLDPFAQLFQHCWGRARSLRMVYKDLWVVSCPQCTAGPNNVGSCCNPLHTTANTEATTPNIVTPTMLGVVASVCMQPKALFTWRWGTPGRWGNPLRWGTSPVHIISHFNFITFAW